MPTYIALLKWTGQGIGNVKDSPSRLDAGRKAMKKSGVKIRDTYLTMGRYDLVCVIDAPDDETYATALLNLGAQGNVQTETLKAFSEDQYRKICASIG
ncbi:MAG TPA: GYD domain-containing protein [Pyrinomonadaceae bacterium]|nr:GYD domain-containing protein [Pyrinomonadaceae bacterium]